MVYLNEILKDRLEKKGISPNIVSGFIRNLANTIRNDPRQSLSQVNKHLQLSGWDGLDLDYQTFQLAMACIEAQAFKDKNGHQV